MKLVVIALLAALLCSGCAGVGVGYSCQKTFREPFNQGWTCEPNYGFGAGIGLII